MQIANPIYDVVFKYLMEDDEVAKLIISTIIGAQVEVLSFLPQENTIDLEHRSLTVYRLDFSARIRQQDGTQKQVLIEIQKAKFSTDLMRFRRYLGKQYQDKRNYYDVELQSRTRSGQVKTVTERRPLPIIAIYFLGYPLRNTTAPVVAVTRTCRDISTNELTASDPFIDSLTHDAFVIQIPYLGSKRRSEVEELLMVFDQDLIITDNHVLVINEADYPPAYRAIIRRLQAAIARQEVRETMDVEDEILEELASLERVIARQDETLTEQQAVLAEKDEALAEKDEALAEKDEALAEKDEALAGKDEALAQQQRLIEQLRQQLAMTDGSTH